MHFTNINIILLNIFLFSYLAYGTDVQTCTEGVIPHFVNISNCEREPCHFLDGEEIEVLLAFTVPKYSTTIKPIALIYVIPSIPINYPLPIDGCTSIVNGSCPVNEAEIIFYRFVMPINNYPKISFQLQFELKSDIKETITCFKAKCVID